jgi:RNA polymerase sigma-70 factor (ECF subfamily)
MGVAAARGVGVSETGPTPNPASHRTAVRAFVLKLVGDEALADDLTQDAYVRAQKTEAGLREASSEKSWLFSIALNTVRDHYRANGRTPATTPDPAILDQLSTDDDTEHAVLEAEMSSCVLEYVMRLRDRQLDVVAMHDMAGLKHAEIGAILGISEANSRVLLHRGRAALRALLENGCVLTPGDSIPCERKPDEECNST